MEVNNNANLTGLLGQLNELIDGKSLECCLEPSESSLSSPDRGLTLSYCPAGKVRCCCFLLLSTERGTPLNPELFSPGDVHTQSLLVDLNHGYPRLSAEHQKGGFSQASKHDG